MSFFIKGKRKNPHVKTKANNQVNGKAKFSKKNEDDELTSSESEDDGNNSEEYVSEENEQETAQEKRLRLAKIYLQEIEKEEKERSEDKESLDQNAITNRLKEDFLKQAGKFRRSVADQYQADLQNITYLRCKEHKSALTCICVTPDCKFIFSGSKDGNIVKWSLLEKRKIGSIPFKKRNMVITSSIIEGHSCPITCLAIADDCKYLVAGDESNDIQIWDPDTLKHIRTLKSHRSSVTGVVFRKDTHTLYSCGKDKSVKVWSLDEMAYLETLFGHQDSVAGIDALSRDRVVTAGGIDRSLRIWKITEESQLLFNGSGSIDCIKLINEENFLSGGDAGELCVWSSMKKKPLCSVKDAHGRDPVNQQPLWISCVATLLNTDLVASGSSDGFIRLWKIGDGYRSVTPILTIPIAGFINSMSFTSDGKYLLAGVGQEHRLGRWQTIKEAKNCIVIIPLIMK